MSRLEQIEKMLQAEPNDAFLNFALAMEYVKLERHEDAVAQFGRASQCDPNYVPAHFQRGRTLAAMGRTEEAIQALQKGITVAQGIGDNHAASEMSELLATLQV